MRYQISCTALGLALVAMAPLAQAQTVVTQPAVLPPPPPPATVVTRPAQTVRTVTTVRTVRPAARGRVVVRRHTYVTTRVVPATTTTTTTTIASAPVAPAPVAPPPVYDYVPPASGPAPLAVGATVPLYRYVYQDDRILVVDPNTGIAVQALPR